MHRNKTTVLLLAICTFLVPVGCQAQLFYRFKADFTIKEKTTEGKLQLTKGAVYYDKHINKLVYNITFPEKAFMIITDSAYHIIHGEEVISTPAIPGMNELTIFRKSLDGDLRNYGLDNTIYSPSKVENADSMVITTWEPDKKSAKFLGKLMLSHKDNNLFGVVFFNPDEEVIGKEFMTDYVNLAGFKFPSRVIHITYKDKEEFYKVTTFENIIVDEPGNEGKYDHAIPKS
ncbi:MAG: hypothetical protein IH946_07500 [Bacteroidetes bacterium]|nr:hypothetical protein [Bacteroidota bacterium]